MMNLPAEVMLMICHARPALTQADRRSGKTEFVCAYHIQNTAVSTWKTSSMNTDALRSFFRLIGSLILLLGESTGQSG